MSTTRVDAEIMLHQENKVMSFEEFKAAGRKEHPEGTQILSCGQYLNEEESLQNIAAACLSILVAQLVTALSNPHFHDETSYIVQFELETWTYDEDEDTTTKQGLQFTTIIWPKDIAVMREQIRTASDTTLGKFVELITDKGDE